MKKKKYHIVPYKEERITDIFRQDEKTDDIKLKTKIIQTLHKTLRPYNPDINNVTHHNSIHITREQMSQTTDVTKNRDIEAVVNILSKPIGKKVDRF